MRLLPPERSADLHACCASHAGGGNVPVVYQFRMGQGKPAEALAQVQAGVKDKKVDSVFISTNNITFAAGAAAGMRSMRRVHLLPACCLAAAC